ncbi:PREDICTED: pecanex-like protein 4 [Amphimedon queenslandica]|uniref:Pecanex-like protein n=2 Tax=Amphimedon queenslandica TaxID=400682 RepID=A0AAN0J951_AMPQE|nr:PREDICTED: pecanex-like protein 4 [Amphimedon queenslandica]|eukprot:XP_019853256.1 PREDICTED: pecanex-like protein 4 [Amphimedon queenslandica]
MPETVAPLLNEYKNSLLLSRLLQTISGGIQFKRGLPCSCHVIQSLLWLLPFLLSLPLTGLSFVPWSGLYLGMIYGGILGLVSFTISMIIKINAVYVKKQNETFEEDEDIHSFSSVLSYVFALKTPPNLILHLIISGLTGFTSFVLLDVGLMRDIMPTGVAVLVHVLGWVCVCTGHYSLLVSPPVDFNVYRNVEQDRVFQLRFISRSFYVFCFGFTLILTKYIFNVPLVFFYVLYVCFLSLPLLWALGVLPSPDSLLFYLLEQSLVILTGGSVAPSEIRLLCQFLLTLVSIGIILLLNAFYTNTAGILASGLLGFLLSLNLLQFLADSVRALCSCRHHHKDASCISSSHYSFHLLVIMREIHLNVKNYVVKYSSEIQRTSLLMIALSLILYYTMDTGPDTDIDMWNNSTSTNERRLMSNTELYSSIGIIILAVFEEVLKLSSSLYCFQSLGGVRNPLHPRERDSSKVMKDKRKRLFFFTGGPRQYLLLYVYPLCMVTYIGFNIESSTSSSSIVFVVATLRILRKIWQDTVSALHELSLTAILSLSLFYVSNNNSWIILPIGVRAVIVGYGLLVFSNFRCNLHFYLILLLGLLFDSKLRTRKHSLTLFLTFLLLPFSLLFMLLSSLFSSPLLPLFTLPILLPVSPRPLFYWPRLFRRSFSSESLDGVFYKQAKTGIVETLSITNTLTRGASNGLGEVWLIRFQDRTVLAQLLERGYGYQILSLLGLELQETSCHAIEVARLDEAIDLAYTSNCPSLSFYCNPHLFNVFAPVDAYVAEVYSDARNSLSGIIDQPAYLAKFYDNFFKTLIYVTLKYCLSDSKQFPDIILNTRETEARVNKGGREPIVSGSTYAGSSVHVSSVLVGEGSQHSLDIESLRQAFLAPKGAPTDRTDTIIGSPNLVRGANVRESSFMRPGSNRVTPLHQATNTSSFPPSLPLSSREIAVIIDTRLPQSWHDYLLDRFSLRKKLTLPQLANIKSLTSALFSIITSSLSSTTSVPSPYQLYKGFNGAFSNAVLTSESNIQWLQSNRLLSNISLKAFRYAVKLLYDEAAIGEPSDNEELFSDYLSGYDTDWYIGNEDEGEWADAVLSQKPHLFSMDYDQETSSYSAHILSLQDELLHILQLNPSALKGVWSNLSWELQYLTNDDEERYSIQAHKRLLRNLLTQTAAIPLGYYIYESDIINLSQQ